MQAQYLSTQPQETPTLTQAMKARQKRRVAGPTTGSGSTKATCIDEKQRVRQPAPRWSESESELDNQLSGILRKGNKQTCILVCLCTYVCMRSESESVSHSSPPQFKGVRVTSACVYYFTNLSTVSVCLSVHTVRQTHTHKHNQD
jgi:hypothetical protein